MDILQEGDGQRLLLCCIGSQCEVWKRMGFTNAQAKRARMAVNFIVTVLSVGVWTVWERSWGIARGCCEMRGEL